MKTDKEERFTPEKNQDGTELYCPFDSEETSAVDAGQLSEDCVEKDVVERYSGNIDIKR